MSSKYNRLSVTEHISYIQWIFKGDESLKSTYKLILVHKAVADTQNEHASHLDGMYAV